MDQPLRRNRFQIHLSTAIVLTFTAGFLLWLNIAGRLPLSGTDSPLSITIYGWPYESFYCIVLAFENDWHFPFLVVAIDCLVALFILSAVWFLSELFFVCRAAGKGVSNE